MKTVQPIIMVSTSRWKQSHAGLTVGPLMSLVQKVEWEAAQTGMCQLSTSTFENACGCTAMDITGVMENDRVDRLAGKATLTSRLLLGRSEVLRSSRHYLQAQSQRHHTIDRLEERGVEKGSARRSSLKGRERAVVSQTNTGTVSKATSWKLLRDRMERIPS